MALTDYQRGILALLAAERIERQESYLAGGAALTAASRIAADLPGHRPVPRHAGSPARNVGR